jgi:tRNA threonylcarbamoyladenosine biosynthesis protein TsaE
MVMNSMIEIFEVPDENAMRDLGASLSARWRAGDLVLLMGDLGAGKTTFVRGVLNGLGHIEPVRSPTFNILQIFETDPPVLHADLYRMTSSIGIGLEDYLETHLCLIEWPERAPELAAAGNAISVEIEFTETGRSVRVTQPDQEIQ